MYLRDEVEMLRRVPIFSAIGTPKLKLLAFTSERKQYRSGASLCRQGDLGDAAFVILAGSAEVLVHSKDGDAKVADVYPNSIVGEIAILCHTSRTATVRATTNMDVLRIGKEQFVRLVDDNPYIAIAVMRVLAGRLIQTTGELATMRAEHRAT